MRRLACLAILVTLVAASPTAAASPSPGPSGDAPPLFDGVKHTLDVVRALDPRFGDIPDLDDAKREVAALFDYAPVLAASWIAVVPTLGSQMLYFQDAITDDPWFGLGGNLVEVMLVADCVTTDVASWVADPDKGDPCGWRHTWLYRVTTSGEATLLFDAGSPDTP